MNKLTSMLANIKRQNDNLFLKTEKITIIDRNKVFIQNYDELIEIQDHFIHLSRIYITGSNLKILSVSKYFIEITGTIEDIKLGDVRHED